MGVFFGSTEITGIKNLFPSIAKDITELYFGNTELFTVWDTYDGTLPAQFNANGDNLKAYKVWGNTGGVGKETVNLWDGVVEQGSYTDIDGNWEKIDTGYAVYRCRSSKFIEVVSNTTYNIKSYNNKSDLEFAIHFLNENFAFISEIGWLANGSVTFQTPSNCQYIDFICKRSANNSINPEYVGNVILSLGSIAPESYIPYGYEVDVGMQENLWISSIEQGAISTGGSFSDSANRVRSVIYNLTSGESYAMNCSQSLRVVYAYSYDGATLTPVELLLNYSATGKHDFTFTMPSGANAIGIGIQNNEGSSVVIVPSDVAYKSLTTGNPTATPIYIGSDPLEKDEYVDSVSGKVYRRTENLFDGKWLQGYYAQSGGGYVEYSTWICFKNKIPCKPNTEYTLKYFANSRYYSIGWYTENDTYISMNTSTVSGEGVAVLTATSPANAAYLACSVAGYPSSSSRIAPEDAADTVLIEDSTAPSTYIPYLQPTDPPVALPAIPTVGGTTIIEVDSTIQPEKVSFTYRKEGFE